MNKITVIFNSETKYGIFNYCIFFFQNLAFLIKSFIRSKVNIIIELWKNKLSVKSDYKNMIVASSFRCNFFG